MQYTSARKAILVLLACASNIIVYAQQLGGTETDSKLNPNGSSEGVSLSSIHVPNLYDGSTVVNIPIYSFRAATGGNFGVSLNYSTKGVKADQLASSAGLNWVLQTGGGSIQRIVKDIPDELFFGPISIYPDMGDWYGGYVDYNEIRGRYATTFETSAEAARTTVYRDKESDEFIVSAGGMSFTFYIGKSGALLTVPENRATIELLNAGNALSSWAQYLEDPLDLGFRITDVQGTQYYFKAGTEESKTLRSAYKSLNPQIVNYRYIAHWVIDKIILPNGSAIQYNYISRLDNSFYRNGNYVSEEGGSFAQIGYPGIYEGSGVAISSIEYPNDERVDFGYGGTERCDDNNPALKKITVTSGGNCMVYKLNHAYFLASVPGFTDEEAPYGTLPGKGSCNTMTYIPPNSTQPSNYRLDLTHRLKLLGIDLLDCAEENAEPYYTFEYDAMPLGVRGSGQDYFGYYNGKKATWGGSSFMPAGFSPDLSIPFHYVFNFDGVAYYGLDRTESLVFKKAGSLKKLKNATGGELEFIYEEHSGLSNPLANVLTLPSDPYFLGLNANDGLRLSRIMERERFRPGNERVTEYTYEQGQRFLTGGYFHSDQTMNELPGTGATHVSFNATYVSPHHLVNGANHGYGKVTAHTFGASFETSTQVTTFTNLQDASNGNAIRYKINAGAHHYFEVPFSNKQYLKDWEMGLPLTVTYYDGNGKITKAVENEYTFHTDSLSAISKQVLNTRQSLVQYDNAPFIATNWGANLGNIRDVRAFQDEYRPYSGTALLRKSTVRSYYSDNGFIIDSTLFAYDARNNLVEVTNRDSDGSFTQTKTIYNYAVGGQLPGTTLFNLTQAGLELVLGTERWKTITASQPLLLDASISTFAYDNGKIALKSMYELSINEPLTAAAYTGYQGGPNVPEPYQQVAQAFSGSPITYFDKTAEVIMVDEKGNPTESRMGKRGIYKAMIWDGPTGKKLAEVADCRLQDMAYSSFESGNKGRWTYDQGNVLSAGTVPGAVQISGSKVLKIVNTETNPIGVAGLDVSKEYEIGFWCTGGTPALAGAGLGNIALYNAYAPGNGWTYYKARFQPQNSDPVGLVSSGTPSSPFIYYIDDIRLHPVGASMVSMTYGPLLGISSETDSRGRISYIEYDNFGRVQLVRDQEGNILSKKKYVVNGAD
ncbi:hypothetical protein FAZ19_15790 [Sphingobacterium alkalisoli]|uniref:YD repeat-containing protein n=1 Tax=Sphingobacterium alkalisoli TaxID=1874115 RepID=A0A4U0GX35_9SPHI|nr:hypothetical protein [Sphingobacterium alkalisoli]TJY63731.1 hypothetical protein FAZ19_15790 [Sphingobacterium alkalisoli]GGH25246.1 hypothetical protein GCM10011418_33730 [Sphingobacterium alkalisoli]